jgi:hypothetical protein
MKVIIQKEQQNVRDWDMKRVKKTELFFHMSATHDTVWLNF